MSLLNLDETFIYILKKCETSDSLIEFKNDLLEIDSLNKKRNFASKTLIENSDIFTLNQINKTIKIIVNYEFDILKIVSKYYNEIFDKSFLRIDIYDYGLNELFEKELKIARFDKQVEIDKHNLINEKRNKILSSKNERKSNYELDARLIPKFDLSNFEVENKANQYNINDLFPVIKADFDKFSEDDESEEEKNIREKIERRKVAYEQAKNQQTRNGFL